MDSRAADWTGPNAHPDACKDWSLIGNRYSRIAAVAAVFAALAPAAQAEASPVSQPVATASGGAAHSTANQQRQLTKRRRARLRRQLARRVRRNPGVVFEQSFMRLAAFVDFRLPMTVRLSNSDGQGGFLPSGDAVQITWDDALTAWPLAGGAPAAAQITTIDGSFTLEADFGADARGSGELGTVETVIGGGITMTATPFTISEIDPACGSSPQLTTNPAADVPITSAGSRYGLMNPFAETIRGTLDLRMTSFTSQITSNCGDPPTDTPAIDNSQAPPMPVHFGGRFTVSPAITPDGKIRFGKITVDDSVTPQVSTFAYVRSCTGTATCDPRQFPARLKLKTLTAEVLLGRVI